MNQQVPICSPTLKIRSAIDEAGRGGFVSDVGILGLTRRHGKFGGNGLGKAKVSDRCSSQKLI